MDRVAIGDVHGSADQLEVMLGELHDEKIQIVFLGDYVNRGKNSKTVLDILISFQKEFSDTKFLCGNHDWGLLQFLTEGNFHNFASAGGLATINSYLGGVSDHFTSEFRRQFPETHLRFLKALSPYFETNEYLFSHTGMDTAAPEDRAFETMVLKDHSDLFLRKKSFTKTIVCGHYAQTNFRPFIKPGIVCLDTGCGTIRGPLSALRMPTGDLMQVHNDLTVTRENIAEIKSRAF